MYVGELDAARVCFEQSEADRFGKVGILGFVLGIETVEDDLELQFEV